MGCGARCSGAGRQALGSGAASAASRDGPPLTPPCPPLLPLPPLPLPQVPEGYAHPAAPIRLAGAVTHGFGRGSRQLGVPTANLPPEPLAAQLAGLADGVYFGCAAAASWTGPTCAASAAA